MSPAAGPWVSWEEGPPDLDPLDLLEVDDPQLSGAREGEGFYWECAERGEAIAALGAACPLEGHGQERFAQIAGQLEHLAGQLHVDARDLDLPAGMGSSGGALLVGGFAFDATARPGSPWQRFGEARFVLPAALILRRRGRTLLVAASRRGLGEARARLGRLARLRATLAQQPPRLPVAEAREMRVVAPRSAAHYQQLVARALSVIRAGGVEKLVLARALRVESPSGFAWLRLLRTLRRAHPRGATFAVVRGRRVFLGATPERLLRVEGGTVLADAVAGSAPRGRAPESDTRLRRELRESKKEQEEHAFVARHVAHVLRESCADVRFPEAPEVLATEGIQHLHTPFQARRSGAGILELAARLHPTPAVAGAPAPRALRWLRRLEDLERGWYAGGVGWLGTSGDGELSVALRSALLEPGRATLYAGAGIVRDSEPEAELAESRLKLGALLTPLLEL